MTVPKFPVMVRFPFPSLKILSMNRISPPTCVQAKPVTTPGTPVISDKLFGRGTPKISSILSMEILESYSFPIAVCRATHRATAAICFSNPRTPLSEVCASIICFSSAFPSLKDFASKPFSSCCFLIKCLFAISTFSSKV